MKKVLTLLALLALATLAWAQPTVDGTIGADEYANTAAHEDSGTTMAWTIEGDTLYFAMTMPSRGWAGVGFASEITDKKQGFDMYIVTMQDDAPVVLDMYQAATRNAPELDEDEGGSNSILESAAVHADDVWTVEFSRPLDTGEATDVAIVPGNEMIVTGASTVNMDLARRHERSNRGGAFVIEGFVF